jgi:vacuolar-type H+-ATPase subunit I/STV1
MKDNSVISRSVKQLEKEIYRSSSLFDEINQLTSSLKEIEKQARNLEELTEKDPKLNSAFQKEMKGKEVIDKFKELQDNLLSLRKELKKSEDPGFRTDIFLENYRTKKEYAFKSSNSAFNFLDKFLHSTNQSHVFFGPRLLGLVDLNVLGAQFKLAKVSPNYLKVPAKKLEKVISFLQENFKPINYVVEAKETRFEFVNLRQVTVKTTPDKLRRLDALSKLVE